MKPKPRERVRDWPKVQGVPRTMSGLSFTALAGWEVGERSWALPSSKRLTSPRRDFFLFPRAGIVT